MANLKYEAQGFFKIEVSGGKRGHVDITKDVLGHEDGWLQNMILDNGFTIFLNKVEHSLGGATYGCVQLGTGTSATVPSQTGLEVYGVGAGSTNKQNNVTYGYNAVDGYAWTRRTANFATGVATGTWSEIASAPEITGPCFSRALITDGGGSPTNITILSDETLTVTYELRWWWVIPAPHVITFDSAGTPFSTTVTYNAPQPVDLTASGAPQNFYLSPPSGYSIAYGPAATANSRTIVCTFSTSQGNPSIVELQTVSTNFPESLIAVSPICTFSPALPKTNLDTYTITILVTLSRR